MFVREGPSRLFKRRERERGSRLEAFWIFIKKRVWRLKTKGQGPKWPDSKKQAWIRTCATATFLKFVPQCMDTYGTVLLETYVQINPYNIQVHLWSRPVLIWYKPPSRTYMLCLKLFKISVVAGLNLELEPQEQVRRVNSAYEWLFPSLAKTNKKASQEPRINLPSSTPTWPCIMAMA